MSGSQQTDPSLCTAGTVWEGGHHVVGLASWKGTIKPGQVSHALVSSLDLLPTFANLAQVSLPSDRAYDGMDISPVLLHGATEAHKTLFHPRGFGTGTQSVPAMRFGKYKAFFVTGGSTSCRDKNGQPRTGKATTIHHNPPLVFDVLADPAESKPIDPSTIGDVIEEIQKQYVAFWLSVNTTMRSQTSFDNDPAVKPCSNPKSSCCRLPTDTCTV